MGQAYLAQHNLEEAENVGKKSLKLGENNHLDSQKLLETIKHYRSGCKFLNNNKWNVAIDKFKESIKLESIFTEAHCELSRAYFEIGNLEAAKNAAEKVLGLRDEYPPAQKLLDVITCYRHLEDKQYDAAIGAFTETINKYPDFTAAHCGLAQVYLQQGNLPEAEISAKKALGPDPDYPRACALLDNIKQAYYDRGCDHLDNQRYNEAIAAFNEVINRDSSFIDAHCQRGRAYLKQGNLDAARKSARTVRILGKNNRLARTFWEDTRQAHVEDGRAALERGELDIAENIASAARRFYRNWPPAHELLDDIRNQRDYKRGMASLKNEQFDEAIAAFNEVIDRDSNFIDAYCGLAKAYLGQDRPRNAEKYTEKVLKLDENYKPALQIRESIKQKYCELARHSFNRDNLTAAENYTNEALRIDENCQRARQLLRDIQLCSLQIDVQETRADRERGDRGSRRAPRRRDRGSRRSPRRRDSNNGAFQRLWSAIRNRLRHH